MSKILLAVALLILAAPVTAQTFDEAMEFFQSGDYAEAVDAFQSLANNGNAAAMNNLGVMYQNGWGVPQDDVMALLWYGIAAENGDSLATQNLESLLDRLNDNDMTPLRW